MKKALICVIILVYFSGIINAQRAFPPRRIKQTHPVLRHRIFIYKHPLRTKNQRRDRIKQVIIQSDSAAVKPRL
jgi:hypothetical protein